MADLAHLLHSPQFFCCLSSLAGSFIPAALTDNLSPKKRVLNFICGALIGICSAPAITFQFLKGYDYATPIPYFMSFAVGMVGVSSVPLVMKLSSASLRTWLRNFISEKA